MKVVVTAEARRDLLFIGDYIAKDNPLRAVSFVEELEIRCGAIADHPYAYALLPRHEESGIRRAVHGRYSIFYIVAGNTVHILHIFNGAMNYEVVLFPGRE